MTGIDCVNVTKRFGAKIAVSHLSFRVGAGEVLAVIGRNGAGKSVTARLTAALSWPTHGLVRLNGRPTTDGLHIVRHLVGSCVDHVQLWTELTASETVDLLCDAYQIDYSAGHARVESILSLLYGEWHHGIPVKDYSMGMARKLGLAISLMHEPRLLVWDEPEAGLDAPSRRQLVQLVSSLRESGHALVVATHSLELVEAVAGKILVLRDGQVNALITCNDGSGGIVQSWSRDWLVDAMTGAA